MSVESSQAIARESSEKYMALFVSNFVANATLIWLTILFYNVNSFYVTFLSQEIQYILIAISAAFTVGQIPVLVRGSIQRGDLERIRRGVWLSEGRTGGARIVLERRGRDRTYLKATIREGKNREVRRVFAKLGYPVLSLKRIRIGKLTLHGLGSGKYRFHFMQLKLK